MFRGSSSNASVLCRVVQLTKISSAKTWTRFSTALSSKAALNARLGLNFSRNIPWVFEIIFAAEDDYNEFFS